MGYREMMVEIISPNMHPDGTKCVDLNRNKRKISEEGSFLIAYPKSPEDQKTLKGHLFQLLPIVRTSGTDLGTHLLC